MKPGDAAVLLGIDRSTITRWTANEFKQYLTPGAQGGSGRQRVITDRDLRVLLLVKNLKATNTPLEEIHVALRQLERDDWDGLPDMPEAPPGVAEFPVMPTAAAEAALSSERRSLLREIAGLQQRIEQLEAKLDEERGGRDDLLREIGDLRQRIGEQETELRLWRAGRLTPPDE